MANYQRQNTFVSSLRQDATMLMDSVERVLADAEEYTAVGGQTFFDQYFLLFLTMGSPSMFPKSKIMSLNSFGISPADQWGA